MEARIGFRPSPPKTVSFLVSAGVLANDRDRNPYAMPSAELKNLKCEMTIVDGKVVYLR
jgi:hypothetical protein